MTLENAVNPPTNLSIKNALQLLESLGAVECDWDGNSGNSSSTEGVDTCANLRVSTSLTALGYHLATLPVHPRVGKMMVGILVMQMPLEFLTAPLHRYRI